MNDYEVGLARELLIAMYTSGKAEPEDYAHNAKVACNQAIVFHTELEGRYKPNPPYSEITCS